MLIVTRHVEEVIFIGDSIQIKILGIEWGTVRLGIQAPRDVIIYRGELYAKIQESLKQNDKY